MSNQAQQKGKRKIKKLIAFGAAFEPGKQCRCFGSAEILEVQAIDGSFEEPPGGFVYRVWFSEDHLLVVPATIAIVEFEVSRIIEPGPKAVSSPN